MADQQRIFKDKQAISKHLFCSICMDIFKMSTRTPCGHTFCEDCIKNYLNKYSKNCPQCRASIDVKKRPLKKDIMADQIINELEIFCTNRSKGCAWSGALQNLANHLSSNCKFNKEMPEWLRKHLKNQDDININCLDDENAPKIPLAARIFAKQKNQGKL